MTSLPFIEAVSEARAAGPLVLDLTQGDPARSDLAWPAGELEAIAAAHRAEAAPASAAAARDAVASYLAGHGAGVAPAHVVLARSAGEALRSTLAALCGEDGEALVPAPDRAAADLGPTLRTRPYPLIFEDRWRLDRRALGRAIGARTRAVLVGNPATPTGAALSPEDLRFVSERCAERGLALVADESRLDSTLEAGRSVATAAGCLAVHVSGLSGVCGLAALEVEWIAVAGPSPAAGALAAQLAAGRACPGAGVGSVAPLLARREEFLSRLRQRLGRNRSALASASLREAPWTLQWGGGWWAVLQVNSVQDGDALRTSLMENGVAVFPGHVFGLPRRGHLVVSLLPEPQVFDAALERLERCLRHTALL